jgi:hypothetical protein
MKMWITQLREMEAILIRDEEVAFAASKFAWWRKKVQNSFFASAVCYVSLGCLSSFCLWLAISWMRRETWWLSGWIVKTEHHFGLLLKGWGSALKL